MDENLRRQLLAAMGAAAVNHQTAPFGRHAGTKAMTAGADKPARLISAFHGISPSDSDTRDRLIPPPVNEMRLYRKTGAGSQSKGAIHEICNRNGPGAE